MGGGAVPTESMTVFFPVYNDERTVERVVEKAIAVCDSLVDDYEIIVVNDGSPDSSGEIADRLADQHENVSVVHHPQNLGYGSAVRSGLAASTKTWICFTDGDDEYDLHDVAKLWRLRDFYDLIITFRYVRRYSNARILISRVYNRILRMLFRTTYRDISTGLRLVRRDVVQEIDLMATSPFIGAEIAIKTMLRGFRVGEVGIQTFPREFGSGQSTSVTNIRKTIIDMFACHRAIFSAEYQLPAVGERSATSSE